MLPLDQEFFAANLPEPWADLFRPIEDFGWSVRSANGMAMLNVEYVFQLVVMKEQDLLQVKNFGRKSLKEVKELLEGLGLSLGFSLPIDLAAYSTATEAREALWEALSPMVEKPKPEPLPDHIFNGQLPGAWEQLFAPTSDLGFDMRVQGCLQRAQLEYVFQLVSRDEGDLLESGAFGRKGLRDMKAVLAQRGLSLGQSLPPELSGLTRSLLDEPWKEHLNLPIRTTGALEQGGYTTLGDLFAASDQKLLELRNLGRKSLRELREALGELAYRQGGPEKLRTPRLLLLRDVYLRLDEQDRSHIPAFTLGLAYKTLLDRIEALHGPQTLGSLAFLFPNLLVDGPLTSPEAARLQKGLEIVAQGKLKCPPQNLAQIMTEALERFSEKERRVLEMRFREGCVFSKIGDAFSFSSGRAQQICRHALINLGRLCRKQVTPLMNLLLERLHASGGILHQADIADISGSLDLWELSLTLSLDYWEEDVSFWGGKLLLLKGGLDPDLVVREMVSLLDAQHPSPLSLEEASQRCQQRFGQVPSEKALEVLLSHATEAYRLAPRKKAPPPPQKPKAPLPLAQPRPKEGETLFSGISPSSEPSDIIGAAGALAWRLSSLQKPCSLCEIKLHGDDYAWLLSWAAALRPELLKGADHETDLFEVREDLILTYQEALTLLLFTTISEFARRESREGALWPGLSRPFSPEARRVLFIKDHPSQTLKGALQAVAKKLKVRHVFGQEGTHEYYVTVFLQFGFTASALPRLPLWLSGMGCSEAVQYLLESEQPSPSFRTLWRALGDFRQHRIRESRLRDILVASPWVLPEWIDELMHQAREKPHLGPRGPQEAQAGELDGILLDNLRFTWKPGEEPAFTGSLSSLEALELSRPRYDLVLGGDLPPIPLLRQDDGSYLPQGEISFPCYPPRREVALLDEDGAAVASTILELWDKDEEVTALEVPSGRPLDAWTERLSPKRSYILLTQSDLEVDAPHVQWRLLGQDHKLFFLPKGWPESLQATLEGETIWTPNLASQQRERPAPPPWAKVDFPPSSFQERNLGAQVDPIPFQVSEDVTVDFVCLGRQPLEFSLSGERGEIHPFLLSSKVASEGLMATFGLRRGNRRARAIHRLPLLAVGTLCHGPEGTRVLDPEAVLSVADAQDMTCQFFLPRGLIDERVADLALLEGSTFVRRLWPKGSSPLKELSSGKPMTPQPPGSLAGLGSPLEIRHLYNCPGPQAIFRVASAIVDQGLLDSVEHEPRGLLLHLARDIEPGPGHAVVLWNPMGEGEILFFEDIKPLGREWRVQPQLESAPCCVAISYEGERLGSTWPEALGGLLGQKGPLPPITSAAFLRWMHVPLLHPRYQPDIQGFIRSHPVEALEAWLLDQGLPEPLSSPPLSEQELAAVRFLLSDWKPTEKDALRVLAVFGSVPMVDVLRRLLSLDPRLMGALVERWVKMPRSTPLKENILQARRLLANLRPHDDLKLCLQEFHLGLSHLMGVDPGFLERAIVAPALSSSSLSSREALNLDVALGCEPFRAYLGLRGLFRMG